MQRVPRGTVPAPARKAWVRIMCPRADYLTRLRCRPTHCREALIEVDGGDDRHLVRGLVLHSFHTRDLCLRSIEARID